MPGSIKWRVLVVVDDSDVGKKAVDCAADLCLSGFNSKIQILYVKDIEPIPILSERVEQGFYESLKAKAKKSLRDIVEKLKNAGVDFEIIGHHFGYAAEKIEKTEKKVGPDIVIIGAQKPTWFSKLIEGCYVERTIFETKAPVLVVKPEYTPKMSK